MGIFLLTRGICKFFLPYSNILRPKRYQRQNSERMIPHENKINIIYLKFSDLNGKLYKIRLFIKTSNLI